MHTVRAWRQSVRVSLQDILAFADMARTYTPGGTSSPDFLIKFQLLFFWLFVVALAAPAQVAEFRWRQHLAFRVDLLRIDTILSGRLHASLLPMIARCEEADKPALFAALDRIAADAPLDVAARALAGADGTHARPAKEKGRGETI